MFVCFFVFFSNITLYFLALKRVLIDRSQSETKGNDMEQIDPCRNRTWVTRVCGLHVIPLYLTLAPVYQHCLYQINQFYSLLKFMFSFFKKTFFFYGCLSQEFEKMHLQKQ